MAYTGIQKVVYKKSISHDTISLTNRTFAKRGSMMKENLFTKICSFFKRSVMVQVVLLLLLIFIMVPYIQSWTHYYPSSLKARMINIPILVFILMTTVVGLIVTRNWRDFLHAFSVGRKKYSLLQLKNIIGAVTTCQKLVLYGGCINCIIVIISLLTDSTDISATGPYVVLSLVVLLYVLFIEYLLIPVKINAERVMNAEMDFDEEE